MHELTGKHATVRHAHQGQRLKRVFTCFCGSLEVGHRHPPSGTPHLLDDLVRPLQQVAVQGYPELQELYIHLVLHVGLLEVSQVLLECPNVALAEGVCERSQLGELPGRRGKQ